MARLPNVTDDFYLRNPLGRVPDDHSIYQQSYYFPLRRKVDQVAERRDITRRNQGALDIVPSAGDGYLPLLVFAQYAFAVLQFGVFGPQSARLSPECILVEQCPLIRPQCAFLRCFGRLLLGDNQAQLPGDVSVNRVLIWNHTMRIRQELLDTIPNSFVQHLGAH